MCLQFVSRLLQEEGLQGGGRLSKWANTHTHTEAVSLFFFVMFLYGELINLYFASRPRPEVQDQGREAASWEGEREGGRRHDWQEELQLSAAPSRPERGTAGSGRDEEAAMSWINHSPDPPLSSLLLQTVISWPAKCWMMAKMKRLLGGVWCERGSKAKDHFGPTAALTMATILQKKTDFFFCGLLRFFFLHFCIPLT